MEGVGAGNIQPSPQNSLFSLLSLLFTDWQVFVGCASTGLYASCRGDPSLYSLLPRSLIGLRAQVQSINWHSTFRKVGPLMSLLMRHSQCSLKCIYRNLSLFGATASSDSASVTLEHYTDCPWLPEEGRYPHLPSPYHSSVLYT